MSKKYLFLAGLLLFIFAGRSIAQPKSALEDEAYDYLNNGEFVKAYEAFDKLHAKYPKDLDYQFKLGICCLSYPEKKARAIEIFQDMAMRYKTREAEFYLGRAFHANYMFGQALNVLEPLVATIGNSKKKEDKVLSDDAKVIINNCKNGLVLMQNKISYSITNIGSPINTKEIEGAPIITADESMLIFTYQGKKSLGGKVNASLQSDPNGVYTSDIYMSTRNADSTWKPAVPITALNTKGNDAAIALSPDGSTLFTFLSTNEIAGDIYVSKLNGTEFSKPVPLNENINTTDYWEGSCSISADGKTLYFSSERPTGLGGRDIWASEMVNGDWGPAVNLGPQINTPYDDDAPFIHPDGATLFFSSKGHSSIGGYDIMFSIKQQDGEWTEPKSMGVPLNTTEDDSYYVINTRGTIGYFSSDRATADARGGQDIYTVNPGILGERPIVALYKGVVYGDGTPVEAKIEITREGKDETLAFASNKSTGKYLLTFKPGFIYTVKVTSAGFEPFQEELNLETLTDYTESKKDFNLYSQAYAASNPDKVKPGSVTEVLFTGGKPVVKEEPKNEAPKVTEEVATGSSTTAVAPEDQKQTEQQELAKQAEELNKQEKARKDVERFKEEQKQAAVAQAEARKAEAAAQAEEKKAAAAAKEEERKAAVLAKAEEKKAKEEKKKADALAKAEAKRKKEEAAQEPEVETVQTASPCNGTLPDLSSIKGKSLNDPEVYRRMMEIAGSYCAENVAFKIQVGAYKNPENFKPGALKGLGKVESESYPDGLTRFTVKQFTNLKDAEAHRQKCIAKGQNDSWIVVFVAGKRYTLEEFIMLDFLGKAIN